jgi:hypothetical protein
MNALGMLDPKLDNPLDVLERETRMREGLDDRDLWTGDVLQIILRINGKCFSEAFNRMMHVDVNLALYLMKFLRMSASDAMQKVTSNQYALLNKEKNRLIDCE